MAFSLEHKLISLFFSFFILLLAIACKKKVGNWQNPSSVICLFWFCYTFFPLFFVFDVYINSLSILYIFLSLLMFCSSVFFFDWRFNVPDLCYSYRLEKIYPIVFLLQVSTVLGLFLDILSNGFGIGDVIFNLMSVSNQYMSMRYSDELQSSFFGGLTNVTNYAAVILGGIGYSYMEKKRQVFLLFLVFFPSLIIMLVQAAKGTLFLCMVLFFSSWSISRLTKGDVRLFPHGTWKWFLGGGAILIPAVVSSLLSRGLYEKPLNEAISGLVYYLNSYAFGHLYAFSDWFSSYLSFNSLLEYKEEEALQLGFYTFMSIFRALGNEKVVPAGVYDEYFYVPDIIQSNIYTFFRGGILDFSILGFLIFMMFLGFVMNYLYFLFTKGRYLSIVIPILVVFSGFSYSSFIISVFIWNSSYAAIVLPFLILTLLKSQVK